MWKNRTPSLFFLYLLAFALASCSFYSFSAEASDLQLSKDKFMSGQVEEAITGFRLAADQFPESEEAPYWLVRAYLVQNEPDKAEVEARKIYEKNNSSGIALCAMGDVEYRLGHFELASRYYRQAINAAPGFARAYLGLGKILESERMLKSASPCYEKAFSIDPDDPDIMYAWATVLPRSPEERHLWRRYTETALYEEPSTIENTKAWLQRKEEWSEIKLCRLRESPEHSSIKLLHFYMPNRGYNRYGVEVKINGKKKARLLLDTGASGILLKNSLAKSAGVPLSGNYKIKGFGDEGEKDAGTGLAKTIEVGKLVFENYPVHFTSKEALLSEDGVIGTNVFSQFLITLDFTRNTMLLDLLPPPPGIAEDEDYREWDYNWQPGPERRGYAPFRLINTKIVIPAIANDKWDSLFVLDTGAAVNVISFQLADEVNYTKLTNWRLVGVSGKAAKTRKVNQISITIAGVQQVSLNTLAVDLSKHSHSIGTEIGGFVGYPLLQHVALILDYRTATLRLVPDPSRLDK